MRPEKVVQDVHVHTVAARAGPHGGRFDRGTFAPFVVPLGIKIAASTLWEILHTEGIDPAPLRSTTTWADFLRSQAQAPLAVDFIETVTLIGQRQYILAVIEHASRRIVSSATPPIPPRAG